MSVGLFWIVSALVSSAPGGSLSPAADSPIVVQGVHDRDRQISKFIKDLTPAPVHGQLSRFDVPVCPVVAGVPAEQAEYIAGRLRRIAGAAGMRVAKPGCDANFILIVTSDKSALLKKLERSRPEYFPAAWSSFDIHDLQHDPSPVAAWQFEGAFLADGRSISSDIISGSTDGADFIALAQKTTEPLTRLHPAARNDILTSVVVVERGALTGLTTTQLADYTAMRAFVRTEPKRLRTSAAETILNVIDAPMGSAVPVTLTAWDLSFLKAFYASGKNSYAEYQRSEMQRLMKRELEKAQTSSE